MWEMLKLQAIMTKDMAPVNFNLILITSKWSVANFFSGASFY